MRLILIRLVNSLQKRLKIDVRYTLKGGSWLMLGYVFSMLSVLVTSYLFANYVSSGTYGTYKYILGVGALLTTFSLTGAGQAITQAAARKVKHSFKAISIQSLKYGLIVSIAAIIGAIYYFINGNATLGLGLLSIAILQPLFNNSTLFSSYLIGNSQFKLDTGIHIIKTCLLTCVIAACIFLTNNPIYLVIVFLVTHILVNFVARKLYLKNESADEDVDNAEALKLVRYAKHTSLQGIISGIANQLDKLLIFQQLGAGALATYAFATALPDQYKALTNAVETMLLPRFTKQTDQSIRIGMIHKSIIYFFILFFFLLVYILIAPYIFKILYPAYEQSILLSQIYVLGIIFGIGGLPITALKSQLSNKKLYQFNLVVSSFQIASLLILLPTYGLIGAIIARVLYRAVVCVSAYYIYYKV